MFKQEYGSGNFLKSSLFGGTGLIDGKYAINAGVVRKIGDGHIDKTWTDAWAYYFGASYNISENQRIELYAVGAPQRHGQNLYKQNIAAYDSAYAKGLDGYDPAAAQEYKQSKDGRFYNQNWSPVSSSYKGKQAVGTETFDRYDPNFLNERENFYHKPQVNLNHYINFSDNMGLATVAYFSGGTGGGTGTYGSMKWNYHVGIESPSRFVAWDETIENNKNSDSGSEGILRNSRNDQYTFGVISKFNWKVMENLKTTFGVDWRTAQVDHYREVRDLLGGEYYLRYDSDFWGDDGKKLKLGDKFDYNNTNNIDWIGGFAQAEYTLDQWTAYGTFGFSQVKYDYTDHFKDDGTGNAFNLESDWIAGFQFKGGALYRVLPNMEVYGNFGYVEKVPIFDNVIDDNNGVFADNPQNERFTSFEAGLNTRLLENQLTAKASYYYTTWEDRALPRYIQVSEGVFDILFLTGVNQLHSGFELELAYQPDPMFRFDVAGSFASWELTSDASGNYRTLDSNDEPVDVDYEVAVDGLKIGDAPQTQVAFAASVFPIKGLMAQVVYKYNANYYADWDPTGRIVEGDNAPDRAQVWQVPDYGLLDFHASYKLPFDVSGVSFKVFAHIFNVLDEIYVQDALDNSQYNGFDGDHDADDAEVFLGLPRYFNIGLTVEM
jgi:mRNA-degrading endonuclease HigB of HigAB toxin-antitoxin module